MACGQGQSKRDKVGEEGDVDERSFTDREKRRRGNSWAKRKGKKEKRIMEKRCNAQLSIHPASQPASHPTNPNQGKSWSGVWLGWVGLGWVGLVWFLFCVCFLKDE